MVRLRSRGIVRRYSLNSGSPRNITRYGARSRFSDALVGERESLRVRLEEEVERIEHRHLGDQVHLDAQLVGLLREHEPREVVSLRVLLPVDEVLGRRDLQRIGQDARAAMRRRPQADDLWPERHEPVVAIVRDVIERDVNGHAVILHRTVC